ncbi:hypothetical protein [Cupriavidus necator]|uniref:hypothetical protein n=1 Tax=Cupriavidus necator TaxID=106590 RepID=UPI0012DA927B|nr:hypothetical protein [Cupriavidus necator]QQB76390.1 hypothetical protein I6H87_16785 [Cupriavidus necator]WKA42672.1 hypothetical protein QWP09_09345 [Cupriavidus necator]
MSDAPRLRIAHGPMVNVESHLPADVIATLRERRHNLVVARRLATLSQFPSS